MGRQTQRISVKSEKQTLAIAQSLAQSVAPGDVALLSGSVGAGKSTLARALIQSILTQPEDIPSPTFTLVQTYDTVKGPLWHADLYRITSVFEVEELGLLDAFDEAICLVEWPELLGDMTPVDALHIMIEPMQDNDARDLRFTWSDDKWTARIANLANG